MILLIPLIATTTLARLLAHWLAARGLRGANRWNSWPAATALGMAAVYFSTAVTHFIEPQRSGLVAIVPGFIPWPELAVTASGAAEFVIALALILPRTRKWAALASIALLIALFPANVVAAGGVANQAAPSTPLFQRTILQVVFMFASLFATRKVGQTAQQEPQVRGEATAHLLD